MYEMHLQMQMLSQSEQKCRQIIYLQIPHFAKYFSRSSNDLPTRLPQLHMLPDVVTYSTAIAACGIGGQWQHALVL